MRALRVNSRTPQAKRPAECYLIVGKTELALHTFNNGRYRLVGLLPIGSAELHAFEGPVCIKARLWRDALDDHASEGFASRLSLLDRFSYRRLQGFGRNQTSVVGRFDRDHGLAL